MFHCGRATDSPRPARPVRLLTRLRSVSRFGAVGSKVAAAVKPFRVGLRYTVSNVPRFGRLPEHPLGVSFWIRRNTRVVRPPWGSSRIKNPHHTGGIIASLGLETHSACKFQAKKRCENATRPFFFRKRSRLPTSLRRAIEQNRPRAFSRISEGLEKRFSRPTVFVFSTVGFHGNGGRTCISYNRLRRMRFDRRPRRAERERAFRLSHGRPNAREPPSGHSADGAPTALGTARGPLTSPRNRIVVARTRFSAGRSSDRRTSQRRSCNTRTKGAASADLRRSIEIPDGGHWKE